MVLKIPVCLLDGQGIIQIPPGICGIVFFIGENLITDGLYMGVLGRINFKPAAVEQGESLCLIISCGKEVIHHIIG